MDDVAARAPVWSPYRRGLFATVALLGLVACSEFAPASNAHGDRPQYPIKEALIQATAIVLVTVSEVGEPRWNSEDGREWF